MTDELSRLLAGDLSEAEARAVRARIVADPRLAARWTEMNALPGALAALPEELGGAPPIHARARAGRPWGVLAVGAGGVGLAAALLLALRSPADILLLEGSQLVEGRTTVRVADLTVDVDGVARISVEPRRASDREGGSERAPMDRNHLLAAVAGAAVTVTVYEGVARVHPAAAEVVEIGPGVTRTVGGPAPEASRRASPSDAPSGPRADRIAEMEAELARLRLENQVASGRLQAHEGKAYDWPADAPAGFRPTGFEAKVRAAVAGVPNAEVVSIDCDEYPCIALVRSRSAAQGWEEGLSDIHGSLSEDPAFGGEVGVMAMGWQIGDDAGGPPVNLYGFALLAGKGPDPDLATRVKFRTEGAFQDAQSEIQAGAPAP